MTVRRQVRPTWIASDQTWLEFRSDRLELHQTPILIYMRQKQYIYYTRDPKDYNSKQIEQNPVVQQKFTQTKIQVSPTWTATGNL